MADGGVGRGIDEDVGVTESRDEPGRRREQHAIAEDVAGHVAYTGRGEGHGLDIGAEFAEMAFDGFPRSARGDAHLLVVIALAAAGGEGIAEPMALLGRDRVGGVGEGGGASTTSCLGPDSVKTFFLPKNSTQRGTICV